MLVTSVICMVVSAGLGAGIYKILEMRVPEFLSIFDSSGESSEQRSAVSEDSVSMEEEEGDAYIAQPASTSAYDDGDSSMESGSAGAAGSSAGSARKEEFGDHVIVNKVKIKNEPKLMAQAVKTMLARDS